MSPLAALIADWVITALWPIIGKAGLEHFTGVLFAQAGMAVGLASLAPWLASKGRWKRILSPELRKPLFLMGLFGSGLTSFLFITGLSYTTPSNAAIMAQVEVLYSAALCVWLLKEHVSLSQGLGSLLVVLGTGLIMAQDLSSSRWKGDLLILLTPWMFQVSHIYAKRLPRDMEPVTIAGARLFYGSLTLLPFTAWALARGPRWSWAPESLALIAAQGVGMYSVNHILWYLAIRRMDLAKATALMLSYPALTVLFSWGLGREAVGAVQMAGLALTLSGAYWLSVLLLKAHREAEPLAGI